MSDTSELSHSLRSEGGNGSALKFPFLPEHLLPACSRTKTQCAVSWLSYRAYFRRAGLYRANAPLPPGCVVTTHSLKGRAPLPPSPTAAISAAIPAAIPATIATAVAAGIAAATVTTAIAAGVSTASTG